jgi:hypothetical protein
MNPILQHVEDTIELPDPKYHWVDETKFCGCPAITLKLGDHMIIIRLCIEPPSCLSDGDLVIYSFNVTIPKKFHQPKQLPSRRIHLPLSDPNIFATIQKIINSLQCGIVVTADDFK